MKANPAILRAKAGMIWRPIFAVVVLAVLIFGAAAYGDLTAGNRMAPEVKAALGTERYLSVAVVLDFAPEDFHMKYFQALGTMAGVTGNTVLLRRIAAADVRSLAGNYWVRRIELLPASN